MLIFPALLTSCVLYDTSPTDRAVARLTDADGDGWTLAEGDCNDKEPDQRPGRANGWARRCTPRPVLDMVVQVKARRVATTPLSRAHGPSEAP
jgi:hypothetical protein